VLIFIEIHTKRGGADENILTPLSEVLDSLLRLNMQPANTPGLLFGLDEKCINTEKN
jgi:hypothetical protein